MKFSLFTISLFSTITLSAQIFPIGSRTITFNDPSRTGGFGSGGGPGRQIQTEIYYPAVSAGANTAVANGKFPVVVFGHGFVMTWDVYRPLYDSLARLGYICALPRTEGDISPSHTDFAKDLALVLDRLIQADTVASSPFFGKVNGRGAIGGHSMGGGASFLADQYTNNATCYLTMAPAITNPSSSVAARTITKPMCILSGTRDCVAGYSGHQKPMYDSLKVSECKQLVSITNARHCSFSNGSSTTCNFGEGSSGCGSSSLSTAQQLVIVRSIMIPYFNYFLKGICSEWDVFQNYITTTSGISTEQVCNMNVPQTASISGDTAFCNGSSANLTASPTGFSYTWSNNSSGLNINVNQSGNYEVSVSNAYCAISSPAFTVAEKFAPQKPSLQQNPSSICEGETDVVFSINAVSGADYYVWELPAVWDVISNDSSLSATATPTETATIFITAVNECGNSEEDSLAISIVSKPKLTGVVSGPATLCSNAPSEVQVSLSGSFMFEDAIEWFAGAWQVTNGQGNLSASFARTNQADTIRVYGTNQCGNSDTAWLAISITDTLPLSVSANGNALMATGGFSAYEWYKNDTLIAGASGQTYTAAEDGIYSVVGINANSCNSTSNAVAVSLLSIADDVEKKISIYPNPANDMLRVQFAAAKKPAELLLFDVQGKLVLLQPINADLSVVDVSALPKGVYQAVARQEGIMHRQRLIVQ